MILKEGEKIHLIDKKLFEGDIRRHFLGVVEKADDFNFRVKGYAFVLDTSKNEFVKHPELRTRIFSFICNGQVINVLPENIDIAKLVYMNMNGHLNLTDDSGFKLDINEFGLRR